MKTKEEMVGEMGVFTREDVFHYMDLWADQEVAKTVTTQRSAEDWKRMHDRLYEIIQEKEKDIQELREHSQYLENANDDATEELKKVYAENASLRAKLELFGKDVKLNDQVQKDQDTLIEMLRAEVDELKKGNEAWEKAMTFQDKFNEEFDAKQSALIKELLAEVERLKGEIARRDQHKFPHSNPD